ncbi:hypothetical protein FWH30_03285 [Microgenomates group bacterium]|nr:hypothetical protein [Microgenomates group bacterium]
MEIEAGAEQLEEVLATERITIHLFHSLTCPHCKTEIKWLRESYLPNNPDVELRAYEVSRDRQASRALTDLSEEMDFQVGGVPLTIIGESVIVGFNEKITGGEIERAIENYRQGEYGDRAGEWLAENGIEGEVMRAVGEGDETGQGLYGGEVFNLPVLGEVDPKTVSLPILAVVIGLVDGFNPCAMWILVFLISMLCNMKDRKRMWVLGMTFLVTSAVVYLLFMVSWLNLAMFLNRIALLRGIIALVAIVFGVINIKNYYQARGKEDACEVVDATKRRKIIERIKKVTNEQRFWLAMVGIVVLAASVNVIELMCSLGLPVVFTQILGLNNLAAGQYALYLFLYILFFLIDDIIVFTIAMKTLKVATGGSKYVKYSHLVGGVIMLAIGALMLLKPEILMFNF